MDMGQRRIVTVSESPWKQIKIDDKYYGISFKCRTEIEIQTIYETHIFSTK